MMYEIEIWRLNGKTRKLIERIEGENTQLLLQFVADVLNAEEAKNDND